LSNFEVDQIKEDEMGRACRAYWRKHKFVNFIQKPEGIRSLGLPSHKSEDNIKKDIKVLKWKGME
jgi:hypothetical protein